jgi:hypothetical protein
MSLTVRNTRDLPDDPKIREPWPEKFVEWNKERDPKLVDQLEAILSEAKDEKPLQEFYTKHPAFLTLAFRPHCCWVFPLPRLGGGKYIPDFLFCDLNSNGYHWTLIELESPTLQVTNQDESVSRNCHHAVEQILDYRSWLRDNALAEQKTYPSINDKCDGYVVIGRRDEKRTELEQKRLTDFRDQHIEIASYDRLLDVARGRTRDINRQWEDATRGAALARALRPPEPQK